MNDQRTGETSFSYSKISEHVKGENEDVLIEVFYPEGDPDEIWKETIVLSFEQYNDKWTVKYNYYSNRALAATIVIYPLTKETPTQNKLAEGLRLTTVKDALRTLGFTLETPQKPNTLYYAYRSLPTETFQSLPHEILDKVSTEITKTFTDKSEIFKGKWYVLIEIEPIILSSSPASREIPLIGDPRKSLLPPQNKGNVTLNSLYTTLYFLIEDRNQSTWLLRILETAERRNLNIVVNLPEGTFTVNP